MKLQTITVSGPDGLKGQRFVAELTGCDIFTGPNGAGKSTRLLAVMSGLRGLASVPGDARREYIGPLPQATVMLDFDGARLVRDLSKAKGKASDLADAEADKLVGPHVIRWDLSDFARDTDTGRTKLLEQVTAASGSAWTLARADAWLRDRLELPATGPTRHGYDELARPTGDVNAWLSASLERARALFTESNAASKQATAAVDAQAEERRGAPVASISLAEATARAEALTAEVAALRATVASAGDSVEAVQRHKAAGEARAQEAGEAADALAAAEAHLKRAQAEAAKAQAAVEAAPKGAVPGDLAAAVLAAIEARDKAVEEVRRCDREAMEHAAITNGLPRDGGVCAHCGAADPLGQAAMRSAASVLTAAAVDMWEDARADAAIAKARHARAVDALRAAEDRAATIENHRTALAWAADQACHAADEASRAIPREQRRLDRANAALSEWQSGPVPTSGVVDDNTRAMLAAGEQTLAAARAEAESIVRQQEREAAFQRSIATREQATARLAQVKALGAALRDLREVLTVETFGPLEAAANVLLERSGSDLRAKFVDSANYGAMRGDTFIHFMALSDSEKATVAAGVASAFARAAQAPWKGLILDKVEMFDSAHLPGIMAGLRSMVDSGEIDNVIGAYASSVPVPALGDAQRWLGGAP